MDPGTTDVGGAWGICPWCSARVPWARFAESDDEPGVLVATCPECFRTVTSQPPRDVVR